MVKWETAQTPGGHLNLTLYNFAREKSHEKWRTNFALSREIFISLNPTKTQNVWNLNVGLVRCLCSNCGARWYVVCTLTHGVWRFWTTNRFESSLENSLLLTIEIYIKNILSLLQFHTYDYAMSITAFWLVLIGIMLNRY